MRLAQLHSLALILPAALLMQGCAYGISDLTGTDSYDSVSDRCYALQMDSYLYDAICADLNAGGFGGTTRCYGVQAFHADADPAERPSSWEHYHVSKETWDKRLFPFPSPPFGAQRQIRAPLPSGTHMRVVSVHRYPRGESGHIFILKGEITSGEHAGTQAEIPGGTFNSFGPSWLTESLWLGNGVNFDAKYLAPCGNPD